MAITTASKRAVFRALHQQDCFVLPNPWDAGSARYLQSVGFKALATTSSGFAWSTGRPDGAAPLTEILAHFESLVATADIPINADFENGHAEDVSDMTAHVRAACRTGIAGLSIEDSPKDGQKPLYDLAYAAARIKAARVAIDAEGGDVLLIGRAENFIVGRPDLDDVLRRLTAYAEAGADCLYAPGLKTEAEITAVVRAVAPKPINVLVTAPGFTVAGLSALGVRRISVGGALARCAWGEFMRAAGEIAGLGTFESLGRAASGRDLNALMDRGP